MKYNLTKTFLLLCALFIFALSIRAQEILPEPMNGKIPAAVRLGLKGKVKTLESVSGAGGLKVVFIFNASGNISEQSQIYRSNNQIFEKTVYFYNNSGQKTRAEHFREGKFGRATVYQYDDKNNLIELTEFNSKNELIAKIVNKYNEKDQITESVKTLLKPIVFEFLMGFGLPEGDYKDFFTYDENGNPASIKSFLPGVDFPFVNVAFRYNAQNQKVEETHITQDYENKPPRIARYFYVYNKFGDVAECRHYESIKESNVEELKDRYKVIDAKGTVQNGLLISDKPYMILWSISGLDYQYDAAGNWTKKISKWKVRDTPDFVAQTGETLQRIITYY